MVTAVYRQPVAVAVDGAVALVANARGGSVSAVDVPGGRVLSEVAVGARASDLTVVGGGRVLACDEVGGRLVLLRHDGGRLTSAGSVAVGTSPVCVRTSPDGTSAVVSLLWARRVAVVSLAGDGPRVARTIDLPFAPRALQWLPGERPRVLVADAFGGRLAVLDPAAGRVASLRSVDGQAIGGLALSADGRRVLVSLSLLDERLETTASHISWGGVVSNLLREIAVDELLPADGGPAVDGAGGADPTDRPVRHWTVDPLGETGNGAADPAGVVALPAGGWAVALGGVGQVSVRRPD
ncbi:MAG TPA: hypothetical protein VF796_06270, partial [Humisphaera sp.]